MKILAACAGAVLLLGAGLIALAVGVGSRLPVAHVARRSETFAVPRTRLWELSYAAFARSNDGSYAIVEQDPPARFVTEIVDKKLPYGGTWTYEFADTEGGCRLTVVEQGYVSNPFFRFVARYLIGHTRSLDAYFADLRRAATP